jgi:uncharacterized alpha-E superfamily protein
MLARTADHLFWLARYTERAENTARMLDVSMQTALLPQSEKNTQLLWRAILGICELQGAYEARHGAPTPRNVIDFMVCDPSNPSSIHACLHAARENARAVRGVLTTEAWETINATWLELRERLRGRAWERNPSQVFEWVKYRSHLTRGVMIGTMPADEAMCFHSLGVFLERSDNTARILDVKFHAVPELREGDSESPGDFYHWAALLRSVSAFEVYRRAYSDVITPERVAELLILRPDMPRSLLNCMNEVHSNLGQVRNSQSAETERLVGQLQAELRYGRIDTILQEGLHAFLTRFLARVNHLGDRISRDFLVPLSAA